MQKLPTGRHNYSLARNHLSSRLYFVASNMYRTVKSLVISFTYTELRPSGSVSYQIIRRTGAEAWEKPRRTLVVRGLSRQRTHSFRQSESSQDGIYWHATSHSNDENFEALD